MVRGQSRVLAPPGVEVTVRHAEVTHHAAGSRSVSPGSQGRHHTRWDEMSGMRCVCDVVAVAVLIAASAVAGSC